ncbi:MAG TPA: STAS domain-containing protein [Acidimicrobiia bacterium]|nr:STAS domain-containing protein [Acidimicrobiia bacterium]
MPGKELTARVVRKDSGSVIALSGTVDKNAKNPMENAYEEASGGNGQIILDFNEVDYINSSGIAVLVGILAMARAEGQEVGAVGLTDHYREVFRITRLSDFMQIYEKAPSWS